MPCLLNRFGSTVMQAELDELCHHFRIPRSILIRVPKMGELPWHAHKELGEITFSTITLECGV